MQCAGPQATDGASHNCKCRNKMQQLIEVRKVQLFLPASSTMQPPARSASATICAKASVSDCDRSPCSNRVDLDVRYTLCFQTLMTHACSENMHRREVNKKELIEFKCPQCLNFMRTMLAGELVGQQKAHLEDVPRAVRTNNRIWLCHIPV